MDISTERNGTTLVAMPEGRIDGRNATDFQDSLIGAIQDSDERVVIDLADLIYISSAGLRAVLLIAKSLDQRKAKFCLCALSAPIREVFEISGFDQIIKIHDTRDAAFSD